MRTSIKYLQKYANQIQGKYYLDMPPVSVFLATTLEKHIAGRAQGSYKITIQKYMLADKEEAKSTIRHELAHNIINWLRLDRVISHGKEFHQILKHIAPRTWKRDLHWFSTEAITEARVKMGIKTKEYKPIAYKDFTCANPDCTGKHLYAWKKIPYYIKTGLFLPCKDCGCKSIIQINTTNVPMIFTSVH